MVVPVVVAVRYVDLPRAQRTTLSETGLRSLKELARQPCNPTHKIVLYSLESG